MSPPAPSPAKLTDRERALLTKVQARVKGWARRNKDRARRLEEARALGGAYEIFTLPRTERLHEAFACSLGSTSAIGAGTLYVFDRHLAYHNPNTSALMGLVSCEPASMLIAFRDVETFRVKDEYVTQPGVLCVMKSGETHWWGGMYWPSSVADAVCKRLDASRDLTRSLANDARAQAVRRVAESAADVVRSKDNVIRKLAGDIAGYKAAAKRAELAAADATAARVRLEAALEAEHEACERARRERDAVREHQKALRAEVGALNERVARAETAASDERRAKLDAVDDAKRVTRRAEEESESREGADARVAELRARLDEAEARDAERRERIDAACETAAEEVRIARSDARRSALEAEKLAWALENARSEAKLARETLERERLAFESSARASEARRAERRDSIDDLRTRAEGAERDAATLRARVEELSKRDAEQTQKIAALENQSGERGEALARELDERKEAFRLASVAETAAAAAREAEKHARSDAARTASEAKEAATREERSKRDLERALETLAAKTAELDALRARHAEDSGLSAAEASALRAKLEEKEALLAEARLEIAGTRSELSALALTQERLATAAECAREEAERDRAAAKEGTEEYRAAVERASAAERDAAAARAAEAMARDLSERTEGEVSEWIKRERDAKEELTEIRVAHERLQQEFRDKTASASERVARADRETAETRHKAETTEARHREKIERLTRALQEKEHEARRLAEALDRQKQETYYLYTNYADVTNQLEDTKTRLEREQEESIRMHQGFAAQKMQLSGAAGAGGPVHGLGLGMGPPPQRAGGARMRLAPPPATAAAAAAGGKTFALPDLATLMPSLAAEKDSLAALAPPPPTISEMS